MTNFNEFKNNTEILRKYLQKMNGVTQSEIKPQWVEQFFLKQNNPHIFLQLLHYVLIDFSPFIIFVKVLDYYPTIKDDNDKKFVSNVMTLARKMFDVDVKIDIEQFLSQKFVEKKTEWMAQFCRSVFEMHLKQNKNGQQSKNSISSNQPKKNNEQTSLKQISKKPSNFVANDDDSQDQAPRNLNIMPSNSRKPIAQKPQRNFIQKRSKDSSSDEDMKELLAKKNKLNKIKQKTNLSEQKNFNVLEKKSQPNSFQDSKYKNQSGKMANNYALQEQDQQINEYLPNKNFKKGLNQNDALQKQNKNTFSNVPQKDQNRQHLLKKQPQRKQQQTQTKEYVTRQELMQIMGGVSKNFSQILNKFNEFQVQVGGWVQNINAKISIIQENVKTIKNNL